MDDGDIRGPVLVAIAREGIIDPLEPSGRPDWQEGWLRQIAASFVTLRIEGELRGCIGTIDAHRALGEDVARNAHAAAYRDPRFPPVSRAEQPRLQVEVSVLSARAPVAAPTEGDAIACLRPGVDGLVIEFEECKATFLPQVWEGLPDPLDFLRELRRKAGLPMRFWHPAMKLSRYTVEKYR